MKDASEKDEILNTILEEFEDMKFYSDALTLERVKKVVSDAIAGKDRTDPDPPDSLERLNLAATHAIVSVDPIVMAAKALLDFHDGRTESVELIDIDEETLRAATEMVTAYRRKHRPLIDIDFSLAESKAEVVLAMKEMIKTLEEPDTVLKDMSKVEEEPHHKDTFFKFDKCRTRTWNSGKPYWEERPEGRVLIQKVCTTTSCGGGCQYCLVESGQSHLSVKTGPITSCNNRVIWTNTDPTSEPPDGATIPNFELIDWDHCLTVFPIDSKGHQLSSRFGWRRLTSGNDFHPGIDVTGTTQTKVLALQDGIVERIKLYDGPIPGQDVDSGVWVRSGHRLIKYWHIDPWPFLKVGDHVAARSFLGNIAGWPNPSRNHLHLAIYDTGSADGAPTDRNAVDPLSGCTIFE